LGKGATTFQIIKILVKNDTNPPLEPALNEVKGGLGGKKDRKLGAVGQKEARAESHVNAYPYFHMFSSIFSSDF
jgi:hypothetical protein